MYSHSRGSISDLELINNVLVTLGLQKMSCNQANICKSILTNVAVQCFESSLRAYILNIGEVVEKLRSDILETQTYPFWKRWLYQNFNRFEFIQFLSSKFSALDFLRTRPSVSSMEGCPLIAAVVFVEKLHSEQLEDAYLLDTVFGGD